MFFSEKDISSAIAPDSVTELISQVELSLLEIIDNKESVEHAIEHPEPSGDKPQSQTIFPLWWKRLSSIFYSYLHVNYLVDVHLACGDGESVAAHQLILAHASPLLSSWISDTKRDSQEDVVTVHLPDIEHHEGTGRVQPQ